MMGNWEMALTALIGMSAVGFLLADGERRRIQWIRAMRHCLLRLSDMLRYDRRGLCALLGAVEMNATQQERALTRLLHACAGQMDTAKEGMRIAYAKESAKIQEYGVLSAEDRYAFERVIADLGETALNVQLRLIEEADEQLRRREAQLFNEGTQRIRLIRTLGVCCGAGVFLLLI